MYIIMQESLNSKNGAWQTAMPPVLLFLLPPEIHERLAADEQHRDEIDGEDRYRDHGDLGAAADAAQEIAGMRQRQALDDEPQRVGQRPRREERAAEE